MKVLFRAKEKNTDNYIIGYEYYNHIEDEYYITHYITGNNYKVDKSTRSINFEDMLDNQGNKIFASLSKDGKGGDITELQASSGTCLSCGEILPKTLSVAIYEQMEFKEIELNHHECFKKRENNYLLIGNIDYKKVIGIQE